MMTLESYECTRIQGWEFLQLFIKVFLWYTVHLVFEKLVEIESKALDILI